MLNSELCLGSDHPQPDPAEIPEVEDVVELGGCRQHLLLGQPPHLPGERNQLEAQVAHLTAEPLLAAEVARGDGMEDLVDGLLCGDGAVEKSDTVFSSTLRLV